MCKRCFTESSLNRLKKKSLFVHILSSHFHTNSALIFLQILHQLCQQFTILKLKTNILFSSRVPYVVMTNTYLCLMKSSNEVCKYRVWSKFVENTRNIFKLEDVLQKKNKVILACKICLAHVQNSIFFYIRDIFPGRTSSLDIKYWKILNFIFLRWWKRLVTGSHVT